MAKSFLAVSGVPSADEPAFSRLGLGRVVPIGLGSAEAETKEGSSTLPGFSRLGLGRVDGGTTGPGTSWRGFSDELSPPPTTDTTSSSSCSSSHSVVAPSRVAQLSELQPFYSMSGDFKNARTGKLHG